MKALVKQYADTIFLSLACFQIQRKLAKNSPHSERLAQLLVALKSQRHMKSFSPFQKIEERRDELLNDRTIVELVDYGAGQPEDNRSFEYASQGLTSSISVNQLCKASKPQFVGTIFVFASIRVEA